MPRLLVVSSSVRNRIISGRSEAANSTIEPGNVVMA
jgi:hypothetical protein